MNILKNFILLNWIKFFSGGFFTLFLLFTVGTLVAGFLRTTVTPAEVFLGYLLDLPNSFGKILPISCLIASLFSINKLKGHSELTALFAVGFSRKNFLITIFSASLIVALVQFISTSYLQPFTHKFNVNLGEQRKRFSSLQSKGLKASTIGSGRIWYKSDNYYFSFVTFNKQNNTLHDITAYFYNNYKITKHIEANSAIYDKNNTWIFKNGIIVTNLSNNKFPIKKVFKELKVKINEDPSDFKKIEADTTILNIVQLYHYIEKLQESGINTNEYETYFWDKFSSSIICIIFALMASIGIFNPNRRNSSFGKNIIFIFSFTLIYWLVHLYFLELGQSGVVIPVIACFAVPSMATAFITYFFYTHRKL